jgi:hypothetical protein
MFENFRYWEDANCLNALQNGQLPNSVFEEEM